MKTKPLISVSVIIGFLLLLNFSTGWLNGVIHLLTFVVLLAVYGLFLSSLMPNKTPLISRYALLMDKAVGQQELSYTRKVTWAWVTLLTWVLFIKADTLFFQQAWLKGSFANSLDVFSFPSMAVLFLGEFYLRKQRFPHKDHGSIGRFVSDISQISLKRIWQFKPQPLPDRNNSV